MYPLMKYVDKGLSVVGTGLFNTLQFFNQFKQRPSFTPKWSDKPLLKSWQKTKPPLAGRARPIRFAPSAFVEAREKIHFR